MVWIIADFEILFNLSLVFVVVLKLKFPFNPSESSTKLIRLRPIKQLQRNLEIPVLVHMPKLKKDKHRCRNTRQRRKNSRPLDQSHHNDFKPTQIRRQIPILEFHTRTVPAYLTLQHYCGISQARWQSVTCFKQFSAHHAFWLDVWDCSTTVSRGGYEFVMAQFV